MKPVVVLVVAKAPVPGLAKTRLAAGIGAEAAAEIAAAALLDTLDAAAAAAVQARVVALTGDLGQARRCHEIRDRLADFIVVPQRGRNFAERLANAHADAAAATGLPVLQIGMDTPQVSAGMLDACADALSDADAVLGMARDGGWWVLGVQDSRAAACLADVEMSTPQTGAETLAALRNTGAAVTLTAELADFDTVDDIGEVRGACPLDSRFVRATQGM
ncbi:MULTISPECIES: TIGR04282 family arsenosugar biosynthesis glycosyltransferase [unclassified Mycolicibacterium]|uniref:TIGR04282 family arsenosugar biosynthesis glycosyltransferase n=1 Tax=unclassified Mycolicibacterium TaxID=2636767 RepID=UPI002EDB04F5